MLEVRNLTKRFGGLTAVNDLSFDVEQGDILGLIGPNGSGKTTTFNMISGAYPPTEGTITYRGERLDGLKALEIAKALATEPQLLLLDEVAAGLTSTEIDDVLDLVHQLHDEGITFIVVEHVMKVIVNLSHSIIVIDFGKEIARGTPDEVMNSPAVHAAYLGEEATLA